MLKIPRSLILRAFQVRVCHSNKSFVDAVDVQNTHEQKSYRFESKTMRTILKTLRTLLSCTEKKAYSIWDQYPTIRSDDMMKTVGQNIDILMKNGITSKAILDNPFLIVLSEGTNTYAVTQTEFICFNFYVKKIHFSFLNFQTIYKQNWIFY